MDNTEYWKIRTGFPANENEGFRSQDSRYGDQLKVDRRAKVLTLLKNLLGYRPFYTAGYVITPARVQTVVHPHGYNGSAPSELFPQYERPAPWTQPWKRS